MYGVVFVTLWEVRKGTNVASPDGMVFNL